VTPETFHLDRPWALLLLLAVPLAIAALAFESRRSPRLLHPRLAALAAGGRGLVARLWWLPQGLVVAALALTALGLARPQAREREPETRAVEGIDIVVALDLSTSMAAADFRPRNRLHVAKEVLKEFMGRRPSDRIGLVVFAGDAYTQAPLTLDHEVLKALVDRLDFGVIEDRTAIGNALATALNRLRESDAKSKVIILITDGENNAGQVSPRQAAEMARTLGVRVFPILVGKGGLVPFPRPGEKDLLGQQLYDYQRVDVNPALLQEIARITGGAYANAGDKAELERGLQAVLDRMEKTRIVERSGSTRAVELFPRLLGPAFWLAALGLLLGMTRWRTFP
jgi:Ca-activated chloride channel family protein